MIFPVLIFGQSYNRIWRHFPDSSYSVKLKGVSGTNTEGNQYYGTYDEDPKKRSHYCDVVETGWYQWWFDPSGGSNYSLDSDSYMRYIPGSDARLLSWFPDSGLTLSELRRILSASAEAWIASGGKIENAAEGITLGLDLSDSTIFVLNYIGRMDTLQESATPTINTASWYRACNDTLIEITDFTNNPGVDVPKEFVIQVLTDSLIIKAGSICTFGSDMKPNYYDHIECTWDGVETECHFKKIK